MTNQNGTQVHSGLYHNIIGDRSHNLPACRIVPQPTVLPRAPFHEYSLFKTIITTDNSAMAVRFDIMLSRSVLMDGENISRIFASIILWPAVGVERM
jgi:hypothetical protein